MGTDLLYADVGGAGNQVKSPLHLPAKSPATTVRGSVSVCGYRKYQAEVVSASRGSSQLRDPSHAAVRPLLAERLRHFRRMRVSASEDCLLKPFSLMSLGKEDESRGQSFEKPLETEDCKSRSPLAVRRLSRW